MYVCMYVCKHETLNIKPFFQDTLYEFIHVCMYVCVLFVCMYVCKYANIKPLTLKKKSRHDPQHQGPVPYVP